MTSFGTNLRRRVWQPFLILAALSLATGLLFTFVLPATRLLVGGFALLLFLVALAAGAMLSRNLLSSLKNLARAAEQIAPDALERAGKHPDEIAALAQTITTITSEIREKEQTWMGDIERRNQAVQKLTQILQEQAASFETALNSVDVPVCLFESDGDLVQVNQRFCQFLGTTAENLKAAAEGENEEWTRLYPGFADVADREGFPEAAAALRSISQVEVKHEKRYRKLLENLEKNAVFKKEKSAIWKCRNCGYHHEAEGAPDVCPACLHPKSYFELLAENY